MDTNRDSSRLVSAILILMLLGLILIPSLGCSSAQASPDIDLPPLPPLHAGWRAKTDGMLGSTVKVCAVYPVGTGWGTGMLRGDLIVTEYHVVAPALRPTMKPGMGGIQAEEVNDRVYPDVFVMYPSTDAPRLVRAKVLLYDKSSDIAVLRAEWRGADLNANAPLTDTSVGEHVTAVGNPQAGDFKLADAVVVGRLPMRRPDGSVGVSILVTSDGGIMGGFSGGGVFSEKGLVGAIEWCIPDANVCGAIPASEIKRELERVK